VTATDQSYCRIISRDIASKNDQNVESNLCPNDLSQQFPATVYLKILVVLPSELTWSCVR
jgi:hypothetical protein